MLPVKLQQQELAASNGRLQALAQGLFQSTFQALATGDLLNGEHASPHEGIFIFQRPTESVGI